ncbi:MAG TPA: hypothetical protein VM324_08560 [Egibacteraceae bacterium]|nr:hypothetical protein [Egibacteraceae bacterium]
MTGRLHPLRRDNTAAPDPHQALADARAKLNVVRQLVAERKAGASSLAVAEYELNRALLRVDDARAWGSPNDDDPEAA